VLRSAVDAAEAFQGEVVGTMADTWNGQCYQVRRFACSAIHTSASGTIAAMAHLAGESVGGLKQMQTAAEIIYELTSEAELLLRRWS
jgi:hypothetical protein